MIIHDDCLTAMAGMEPESVDAIVTDPPYGLEFMGKEWDRFRSDDPGTARHRGERAGKQGQVGGSDRYGQHGRTIPSNRLSYGIGYRPKTYRCPKCGLRDQFRRAKRANGKSDPHPCGDVAWIEELLHPNEPPPNAVALQNWSHRWAEAAYRVAKPSAYLLAFGGTRTVHRMTVALEDAGWIIRDMLVWAYASGFPKSKASLKPAWEPIVMARKPGPLRMLAIDECRIPFESPDDVPEVVHAGRKGPSNGGKYGESGDYDSKVSPLGRWPANLVLTDPIFDGGVDGVVGGAQSGIIAACPLCGAPPAEPSFTVDGHIGGNTVLGPALPPSSAPNTTARSAASEPMRDASATARNGARTSDGGHAAFTGNGSTHLMPLGSQLARSESANETRSGLWPDITSPSDLPAMSAAQPVLSTDTTTTTTGPWTCGHSVRGATTASIQELTGGYSRFFLLPKSSRSDREPVLGGLTTAEARTLPSGYAKERGDGWHPPLLRQNVHPTVKPTDLMRHLVRLVTPSGGTVLDCFAGSGSTLIAAEQEGFAWIGIEREREYVDIIEARLNGTQRGLGLVG